MEHPWHKEVLLVYLEIRGLERLSFRERQAVMLKESGRSIEQIAKTLKISTNSVSTILTRAKAKGYQVVCIISQSELGLEDSFLEEDDQENEGNQKK